MSRSAMILIYCCTAFIAVALTHPALAAVINNPGFEEGWTGWMEIDKDGKSVAISSDSHAGEASAKITSKVTHTPLMQH